PSVRFQARSPRPLPAPPERLHRRTPSATEPNRTSTDPSHVPIASTFLPKKNVEESRDEAWATRREKRSLSLEGRVSDLSGQRAHRDSNLLERGPRCASALQ